MFKGCQFPSEVILELSTITLHTNSATVKLKRYN